MTTDPTDEKLDRLLQDWSSESVSHSQLSLLQQRIVASLRNSDSAVCAVGGEVPLRDSSDGAEASRSVVPTRALTRSNRGAAAIAVGMVLTVMLATLLLLIQSPRRGASTSESPPEYAWLQHDQIQNKTLVLQEMKRLFDRQFLWLAENGNQLELGLAETDAGRSGVTDGGDHLAIRIVVQRRQPGSTDWKQAWTMDLVSRSEETVSVLPKDGNGTELQLWAYRLPDGAIAVETDLRLSGANDLHAQCSGVQQNGRPVNVSSVRSEDTEYRVFQTIAVLEGKVI